MIFDKINLSLNNEEKKNITRSLLGKGISCCVNYVLFISEMVRLLEGSYHDSRMIDGLLSHLWTMDGQGNACGIA